MIRDRGYFTTGRSAAYPHIQITNMVSKCLRASGVSITTIIWKYTFIRLYAKNECVLLMTDQRRAPAKARRPWRSPTTGRSLQFWIPSQHRASRGTSRLSRRHRGPPWSSACPTRLFPSLDCCLKTHLPGSTINLVRLKISTVEENTNRISILCLLN